MKKIWIAALAAGWTLAAQAGLGILWTTRGWVVAAGGDANAGPGVAASDVVTWQLVYAGANGVPDAIDYWADGWTSGDDVLLAERVVPAGGGTAADGTSWDEWLMPQDGFAAYLDPAWPADRGGYVFQRVFQGAPSQGTPYAESGLFAFDPAFAGEGAPPDVFEFPADGNGLVLERTVPPSARKYPLWIGGVQVTDDNKTNLTAAIVAAGGAATGTATYDPDENVLSLADFRYAGEGQGDGTIWSALFYNGTNDFAIALSGSNRLEQTGAGVNGYSKGVSFDANDSATTPTVTFRSTDGGSLSAIGGAATQWEVSGGISYGLYARNANIVISGAVVDAVGGEATRFSYGADFILALTVESGSLTATGGRAMQFDSRGIYFNAESLVVRGGTLTAIGGEGARASHGIFGRDAGDSTVSVSGGLLVAEGGSEAIVNASLSAADGMEVRAGASKADAVAVEGDGWREKNYIEVGPPPAVTLSTPGGLATFSEGSTGPALGRIDVGLTTLPTANITVHIDVTRVGEDDGNYPLPELSSYDLKFGSDSLRSQSVYFKWLDGTSVGARDGYLLTAFVTNATAGPSGVAWKDLYAPGAMTNYVVNEAPQIMSFAPTDASPVVAGVPFAISYSVRDVPADFAAGLTLTWTTSEGFTTSYQVTATSVSNYVDYTATSPPFTFSNAGPHSVSLVIEDKDQGTSETAVFDVTVIPPPVPPSVSNVVARQRWPWNGLVDVDYEVGGSTNLLAGLEARLSFAASDGRSWVATNFLAGAEPSAEPGFHRATWNTAADGATNVVAEEVTATVELVRACDP